MEKNIKPKPLPLRFIAEEALNFWAVAIAALPDGHDKNLSTAEHKRITSYLPRKRKTARR